MSSTYSNSLRVELIGSGDQAGAWGSTTNNNFAYIFDSAIAGYVSVDITTAPYTLTTNDGPTSSSNLNQAVYASIRLFNAVAASIVYAPAKPKIYVIWNDTSHAVTLYNTGNSTGPTIAAGARVLVFSTGTAFYEVSAQTINGVVPIAKGGTGQITANAAFNALAPAQTANRVLKSNGTNTSFAQVALTTDVTGTLPVANGGTGVTGSTGSGSVVLSTSPSLTTPILGTPQSGNFTSGSFSWPTFNQNTTGNAATANNATTAGGLTPSATAGVASRIVAADASGYIYNNYFSSTDNSQTGSVSAVMVKAGDNFLRSGTAAAVATFISGQSMNIAGTSTGLSGRPNISVGDITCYRTASPTTGVIFLNSANTAYLYYDGSAYQMPAFDLVVGGNVTAYSDERVKTNWRDLPADFVEQLAQVKHGIYDRTDQEVTQVGVSAQSLQPVMPNAVIEDKDGNLSVAYGNAALVAAIKLAERVVALEAKIAELTKE